MKKKLLSSLLVCSLVGSFVPMLNLTAYVDEISFNARVRMVAIGKNVIALETIELVGWIENGSGRRDFLLPVVEDMKIVFVDSILLLFIRYSLGDGRIIETGSILNWLESENTFVVQFGNEVQQI